MEKKIAELKIEDLKAVIGGATLALSTSVSTVKPSSTQFGTTSLNTSLSMGISAGTGVSTTGFRF